MSAARIALVVLAALVCAGLWLAFRPAAVPVAAVAAPVPSEKVFDFVIREGKRISGPESLRVRQGEPVTLRIESDASDELHVHGYDLRVPLRAGEPATLQFAAARSGRFGLELHRHHIELGALEVYPR